MMKICLYSFSSIGSMFALVYKDNMTIWITFALSLVLSLYTTVNV